MASLGSALRRLVSRVRRGRLDDELREEMAQHLEMRRQGLEADGMDPREAAWEARRMFGNVTAIREETRDMWGVHAIETLMQDTRFGARLLRRSPVFTVAAIASLAIGIGAAGARRVRARALPLGVRAGDGVQLAERLRQPVRFNVLGVAPAAGRLLRPADDRPEAPPAAVIGFDLWHRRFGGRADAVGRLLVLNGVSLTVAGVLPRGFTGTMQVGQPCDVMVPMSIYRAVSRSEDDPGDPNYWWVLMMGRLKPGATAERIQATADLALEQTIAAARPEFPHAAMPRMRVEPGAHGQTENRDEMRKPLQIMGVVVAIVLLVACANVANLLLARGRARGREIAVRTAIGAPRYRIVRQLLTEGLLLGCTASAVGLLLAQWMSAALLPALATNSDALTIRYTLDLRIVGFTCLLATACSLLFALLPALRATDAGLTPALREASRGTVGPRRRFAASGALVVAQVTLSMLLLSVAGLLAWSVDKLLRVDPGFDPANLLTFSVDTSLNGYDDVRTRAFIARALEGLRAAPGVTNATVMSHRLIAHSSFHRGHTAGGSNNRPRVH